MEKGDIKLREMLSLTEEINTINHKVRQLVENLHDSQGVLMNLQELTDKLKGKIGSFSNSVGSYKPPKKVENKTGATASWEGSKEEHTRIVPTPDNENEWNPEAVKREPKVEEPKVPNNVVGSESTNRNKDINVVIDDTPKKKSSTKKSIFNSQFNKKSYNTDG